VRCSPLWCARARRLRWKQDPGWFADLLRLELALHDREPFNRIGAYWHLLATRG
jgi:hypothetical protein